MTEIKVELLSDDDLEQLYTRVQRERTTRRTARRMAAAGDTAYAEAYDAAATARDLAERNET